MTSTTEIQPVANFALKPKLLKSKIIILLAVGETGGAISPQPVT
jgi:hypothetical protein